jgi:hypothetical protein
MVGMAGKHKTLGEEECSKLAANLQFTYSYLSWISSEFNHRFAFNPCQKSAWMESCKAFDSTKGG